ncbi:MAG: sulfatase [Verrucomicrobiota bacterium]
MPKPNVLIIHCDQLRHDWLGYAGHPTIRTPHIDKLAAAGRVFTNHWVSNPVCQPSRASLFTGLHACGHGLWSNGTNLPRRTHEPGPLDALRAEGNDSLERQPPTLGDVFGAAGYKTFAIGKVHFEPLLAPEEHGFMESYSAWHGDPDRDWTGPYYGMDHVEISIGHAEKGLVSTGHYGKWIRERDPELVRKIQDDPPSGPHQVYPGPIPHKLHNTTWIAERTAAMFDSLEDDQPFLGFLGIPGPHHPFSPSFDILEKFAAWRDPGTQDDEGAFCRDSGFERFHEDPQPPQVDLREEPKELLATARRNTAAMIWQIDDAVGKILAALEKSGRRENTYVLFTSDHGDFLGNHGGLLFKHMMGCADLLRVPFVLSGPGITGGWHDEDVMSNTDVLPTLCALTGVTPPGLVHGRDRSQPGSGEDHRAYAFSYNAINNGANFRLDNFSVMDGRYRVTLYPRTEDGFAEIYDLHADPWETRNLRDDPALQELRAERTREIEQTLFASAMPGRTRQMIF